MKAITSLAPGREAAQKDCVTSWLAAGLFPVSMNSPTELSALEPYNIDIVTTDLTAEKTFGKPFVKINAILNSIAHESSPTLIINADLRLMAKPLQIEKMQEMAEHGLPFLLQTNVKGSAVYAERHGISAFMFNGKFADLFKDSFLSLGQPWWDYWIPYIFVRAGLPVYNCGSGLAIHMHHTERWSESHWQTCGVELGRLLGENVATMDDCRKLSARVHREIMLAAKVVTL